MAALEAIERHRATDMLAIPLMTQAVMDALHSRPTDLSSLASVISSGTKSPPDIWDRIDAELCCDEVNTGYGMSETTASATVTRPDDGPERRLSFRPRAVGSIHTFHDTVLHAPILVGATVRVRTRATDKFVKRERRYVRHEVTVTDVEDGRLYMTETRDILSR